MMIVPGVVWTIRRYKGYMKKKALLQMLRTSKPKAPAGGPSASTCSGWKSGDPPSPDSSSTRILDVVLSRSPERQGSGSSRNPEVISKVHGHADVIHGS